MNQSSLFLLMFALVSCDGAGFPLGGLPPNAPQAPPSSGGHGGVGGALVEATGGTSLGGFGGFGGAPPGGPAWTAPVLLPISVPDQADQDPTLTPDELEMLFSSNRPGGTGSGDIWSVKRATLDAPWGAAVPVTAVNSPQSDITPALSADGLSLYFSRKVTTDYLLFRATRPDLASPFAAPVELGGLGGSSLGLSPCESANGLTLYFNRSSTNLDVDFFVATRPNTTSDFGVPAAFDPLNTALDDWDLETRDELSFIYARDGVLFQQARSTVNSAFLPASQVQEPVAGTRDFDPWISQDGRRIYFASTRSGDYRIYLTERADGLAAGAAP